MYPLRILESPKDSGTSFGGFPVSYMIYMSHEKNPGWLDYIGDYTTQLYRDYFINHCKDPY